MICFIGYANFYGIFLIKKFHKSVLEHIFESIFGFCTLSGKMLLVKIIEKKNKLMFLLGEVRLIKC